MPAFTLNDMQYWVDTIDQKFGFVVEEIRCSYPMRRYVLSICPDRSTDGKHTFVGEVKLVADKKVPENVLLLIDVAHKATFTIDPDAETMADRIKMTEGKPLSGISPFFTGCEG